MFRKVIEVIGSIPSAEVWARYLTHNPQLKLAEDQRPYFIVDTREGRVLVAKSQAAGAAQAAAIVRHHGYHPRAVS